MTTSKSLFVQLVWTTLICGRLVLSKPQPSSPAMKKAEAPVHLPEGPPVSVGRTSGFELKQGYSVNIAPVAGGVSEGLVYLAGRTGPGPTFYRNETAPILPYGDLWSGSSLDLTTGALYSLSALVAASSLYYILSPVLFGGKGRRGVGGSSSIVPTAGPKREKRAAVVQAPDQDLTRLADIVLNAIASGECLQRGVCLVGAQMGSSAKGRLAFTLLHTLLPSSLHSNPYFLTMKTALLEGSHCDQFNCPNAFLQQQQ